MSAIKIELTENHVKLLKYLRWSLNKENIISGVANEGDEIAPPFGETSLYEAIDIILNGGKSKIESSDEDFPEYTEAQKAEWDKLYSELPLALDVILFNGSFELGSFKTRVNDRNWKKLNK